MLELTTVAEITMARSAENAVTPRSVLCATNMGNVFAPGYRNDTRLDTFLDRERRLVERLPEKQKQVIMGCTCRPFCLVCVTKRRNDKGDTLP